MPTIVENQIDGVIDTYKESLRALSKSVANLFRDLSREKMTTIRKFLVVCEGHRFLTSTRSGRFAWALIDVREIIPRGKSNGTYTLEICCGYVSGRFLRLHLPSDAVESREGLSAWIDECARKTAEREAFLKEVEADEMSEWIKKNRKLTREILEATKRTR